MSMDNHKKDKASNLSNKLSHNKNIEKKKEREEDH